MEEKKKSPALRNAILQLVGAVILAGIGIFAYMNDFYILLFRVIPLNAIAFGILAAIMLAIAIFSLVKAVRNRG